MRAALLRRCDPADMAIDRFAFPTTIHFGPGAAKLVGPHLREQAEAPALVTDRALAKLPVAVAFADELRRRLDVGVFEGIWGNPTVAQAMRAARRSALTRRTASWGWAAVRRSTSRRSSA
jgi:alcohol dehydrogenase class IV